MTDPLHQTQNQRLYWYTIRIDQPVYDGDSPTNNTLDYGFNMRRGDVDFRLYGVDTPELTGRNATPAGREVRDYMRSILQVGDRVLIRSHYDRTGKYGRPLIEVLHPLEPGGTVVNINQHLVEQGMGELETYGAKFAGWTEP